MIPWWTVVIALLAGLYGGVRYGLYAAVSILSGRIVKILGKEDAFVLLSKIRDELA